MTLARPKWTFVGDAATGKRDEDGVYTSPTKASSTPLRSSRARGNVNIMHFKAIERHCSPDEVERFQIGDAVLIAPNFDQEERNLLSPLLHHRQNRGVPARVKGTSKAKRANVEDARLRIQDGLDEELIGIIIDILQDERERECIEVHWLYRPRVALMDWNEGVLEREGYQILNKELFYASDPYYYQELRLELLDSRDPFSPKKAYATRTTSKLSQTQYTLSADNIIQKIDIVAPSELGLKPDHVKATHLKPDQWLIRRFWNPMPDEDEGEEWLQDFDFEAVRAHGLRTGWWEVQEQIIEDRLPKPSKSKSKRKSESKSKRDNNKTPTKTKNNTRTPTKTKGKTREESDEEELFLSSSEPSSSSEEDEAKLSQDDSDSDSESERNSGCSEVESSTSSSASSSSEDDDFHVSKASPNKRKATALLGGALKRRKIIQVSEASRQKQLAAQQKRERRKAEQKARHLQLKHNALMRQAPIHAGMENMTPFQRARTILHVSATPEFLPCREDEFAEIEVYLEDAIDEAHELGKMLDIAGMPGTGKTATVRSVVQALRQRANQGTISNFRFVEINGMKLTEPSQAYSVLWEFLSEGKRESPQSALTSLEAHFRTAAPGRETCVVLMDELDQMHTKKKNNVIYNFFNWPNQPHSRLIVVTIANTMDLPEKEFSSKVRSRLGSNRILFKPYDHEQLMKILESRLSSIQGNCIEPRAVEYACRNIARITGDARRALDVCRRAVERVEMVNADLEANGKPPRLVKVSDISAVLKDMSATGPTFWITNASLHQKIFLLALSQCTKKQGVDLIPLGDIIKWHLTFISQTDMNPTPAKEQFFDILGSLAAMSMVTVEHVSAAATLDHFQRVKAKVRDDNLMLALQQDPRLKNYVARM